MITEQITQVMKTPDEIKKGLECCLPFDEERCCDCPYCHGEEACFVQKNNDILSLIQQLEREKDDAWKAGYDVGFQAGKSFTQ